VLNLSVKGVNKLYFNIILKYNINKSMSSRKKQKVSVSLRQTDDPTQLYNAFTTNANYSRKELELIKHISNFLPNYIQNENCREKREYKSTLLGIMCEFSYAYVANPITLKQKIINGSLVNDKPVMGDPSINGRIYGDDFDGNPIITKAPISFNEDYIIEIYVNFVLINTILSHNKLSDYLVPSYGLFICPSNILPEDIKVANKMPLQICVENPKKDLKFTELYPFIYLVQKKVDGVTLKKKLKDGLTLKKLKKYLGEVFMVMSCLENSPFLLAHNDLHTSNIMIDNKTDSITIIDWGMASFKEPESGNYYQPFLYNDYYTYQNSYDYDVNDNVEFPTSFNVSESNHTAAHDFLFLFSSIHDNTVNEEIKEYTNNIIETFMKKFEIYSSFYKENKDVASWLLGSNRLFNMETQEIRFLGKKSVYRDRNTFLHNSKVLKECMYWSVATEFGLLTDDQIKEVETMNRYWYSHQQVYKNILTVPNVF